MSPLTLERFARLSPPPTSDEERSRLKSGGVVARGLAPSDGEGLGILVLGEVDAPPEVAWRVMADCEEQEEFMPRVVAAAVREREGNDHTCELVVHLPFPLAGGQVKQGAFYVRQR